MSRGPYPAVVRCEMDAFLEPFEVLPFDREAAEPGLKTEDWL